MRIACSAAGSGPPLVFVSNPPYSLILGQGRKASWWDAFMNQRQVIRYEVDEVGRSLAAFSSSKTNFTHNLQFETDGIADCANAPSRPGIDSPRPHRELLGGPQRVKHLRHALTPAVSRRRLTPDGGQTRTSTPAPHDRRDQYRPNSH